MVEGYDVVYAMGDSKGVLTYVLGCGGSPSRPNWTKSYGDMKPRKYRGGIRLQYGGAMWCRLVRCGVVCMGQQAGVNRGGRRTVRACQSSRGNCRVAGACA